MPTSFGYQIISTLHSGIQTIVYRVQASEQEQPSILKLLLAEYPSLEAITSLKHEYHVQENLEHPGIVKVIGLKTFNNRLGLLLEDFGGGSLAQFLQSKKLDWVSCLNIAIQLAKALEYLHTNQIIHKDIKPSNIIINPETRVVKLTDFGIASRLNQENPYFTNPNAVEGTLAYMSPEQTGRMNRSLDYRTDFYSLGVTLYEILTGTLPFLSSDPLEIVYNHIAAFPIPPHKYNSEIPQAISEIVMKLMAKNAEDRYQSGAGLLADLKFCANQLTSRKYLSNFILGRLDILSQLLIPQKLYGREQQVKELLAAFNRISNGASETILVSGYSGIGKSSVVNEVNKPITKQKGYFISGKFDQFKRNIPYASLIQAFGSLMRQLLTESAEQLQEWRYKLLTVLGTNGQVIIDVIPEVELIIGQQPEVTQLGATESQNRFNRIFKKFISVFSSQEHPLVIFLDDLQWADSATLKLMELLMTDAESKYLLLIGAYRDNEVSTTHLLMRTIEEIQQVSIVNNIVIKALELSHIIQIVSDTLNEKEDNYKIQELASLLFYKTAGNPFFLTQMLKSLYRDKLLNFDFSSGRWCWDIQQIQAVGITDLSVVELIASQISKLPPATQEILKVAACIGDRFKLNVLATTSEKSALLIGEDLWFALQQGLILPLTNDYKIPLLFASEELKRFSFDNSRLEYRFLHDRVQQAAYSLIPENQKQATHLEIGRSLLLSTPTEQLSENIFDIVNQLNQGIELIQEFQEKVQLSELNRIAGQRALLSAAFEPAYNYFTQGIALLPTNSWKEFYQLTVALYTGAAEAACLSTNFAATKELADIALANIDDINNKVKIYELLILYYHTQSQFKEAVTIAVQTLAQLGEILPENPDNQSFIDAFSHTQQLIAQTGFENLERLPVIKDSKKWDALRILRRAFTPAYFGMPQMLGLIVCRLVDITIQYGESPLTPYAFGMFSVLLNSNVGDIALGSKFGELALNIYQQRQNTLEHRTAFYALLYGLSRHFYKPLKSCIKPLIEGYLSYAESGDAEHGAYCIVNVYFCCVLVGKPLEEIPPTFEKFIQHILGFKQEQVINQLYIWTQVIHNLTGRSEYKALLKGEYFDIEVMLPQLYATQNFNTVNYTNIAQSMLYYIFGEYELARTHAAQTEPYLGASSGKFLIFAHNFYYSLSLAALYNSVSESEQIQFLEKLQVNQQKMKKWADFCSENFLHKYLLVEAEIARITGNDLAAMDLYDRAITSAQENGFLQNEALGNELAAKFWLDKDKEEFSKLYMTNAYYGYIRWGAIAKAKDLESKHPFLLAQTRILETSTRDVTNHITTITKTTNGLSELLDVNTFIKFSQTITSEIILETLLSKLVKILLENAAAQKGLLLLLKDEQLYIEAIGGVDNVVTVLESIPVETSCELPLSVINYVFRSQKHLVLNDVTVDEHFHTDIYIQKNRPKSILCLPIIYQSSLQGIIYLENRLTVGAFTPERLEILKVLVSQVAIAIENAQLYAREQEKNRQLEKYLHDIQQAQLQLIQSEKMSSLGNLVAGVAHEIKNPLGFIGGNISNATATVKDLINHLRLYQEELQNPSSRILENAEDIDIEYLIEDLPKMLASMKLGCDRINNISTSLCTFSRNDSSGKILGNIHEGLDSTILILQHRLKANNNRPEIKVIKKYGELPLVKCYLGQLNQVFMNLLANAIDALEEANYGRTFLEIQENLNIITIETEMMADKQNTVIKIKDNGKGISEEVRSRIFDHLYTTKPIGKGTGLGLSISRQIVEETHGGILSCESVLGQGTEFMLSIPIDDKISFYSNPKSFLNI